MGEIRAGACARACIGQEPQGPGDPWRIKLFTSNIACCPGATEVCGSTCWLVISGLRQTLPVVGMKLATIHLRSA